MHERAFRRAVALGAAALLLATSGVFADTAGASTDGVTVDAFGNIDPGTVGPGATLNLLVAFKVTCGGFTHLDPGDTVTVTFNGGTIPPGGAASAMPATIGPAPASWPADGTGCDFPAQTFTGGTPSHLTLTAPTAAGHYTYTLDFTATSPKAGAVKSLAFADFALTVVSDQPPALQLPSPITVEGNTTGGATVTYTATATDAEDSPPPTPTCSPVSGAFFPLGTTTVGCTVTDSGGNTTTGSFNVTVVDTTPPTLTNVPGDMALTSYDPSGTVATWTDPTATDVVDPSPSVACVPASGGLFPVGSTAVTCTTTDASGNHSAASFHVSVALVRLGASFDAPIGPSDAVAINPGRTLPVKATVTRDGSPVTSGDVELGLSGCAGVPIGGPLPFAYQGGRWFLGLDTSGLVGCVTGTVLLDGHPAGAFTMASPGSSTLGPRRPR
ncbi:MAG TPA: HYR domain-containing protein [Candidatus Dormibacteraeota bacterium]|nr:HYR domain-containing protein [Candidatus Dormibacteraeota bacterium]